MKTEMIKQNKDRVGDLKLVHSFHSDQYRKRRAMHFKYAMQYCGVSRMNKKTNENIT